MDLPANLQRKWISNRASQSAHGHFGVLTYNILNKNLAPAEMYPYCPMELLMTSSSRHPLLMKEVDHHIDDVDIICMQEVNNQYYEDVLLPDMTVRGFDGHYVQRLSDNKAVAQTDGSATFYRKGRFQLDKLIKGHFKQSFVKECEKVEENLKCDVSNMFNSNRAVICALFQCKETKRLVAVGNVHLTFDLLKEMNLTAMEAAFAINELLSFCGGPDVPHILCGDFNQEPHYPGYQVLHDGSLNETMATYLRDSHHSQKNSRGHEVPFSEYEDTSTYFDVPRTEIRSPVVQALFDGTLDQPKVRKNDPEAYGSDKYVAALDYVWYSSDSLHCEGVLEMVDEAVILPFHACPNAVFPSDHMPIKAGFSFLESQS